SMDFISKSIMAGRSKLSRVIFVKPYSPNNDDSENDEKENIANNLMNRDSLPDSNDNITEKDEYSVTRAKSLEQLPVDSANMCNGLGRTQSLERNAGRDLEKAELAPVFTTSTISRSNSINLPSTPIKRRVNW
ncbi:hypothetical protein SK128_016004, partial [Halocaridina rubra]